MGLLGACVGVFSIGWSVTLGPLPFYSKASLNLDAFSLKNLNAQQRV